MIGVSFINCVLIDFPCVDVCARLQANGIRFSLASTVGRRREAQVEEWQVSSSSNLVKQEARRSSGLLSLFIIIFSCIITFSL